MPMSPEQFEERERLIAAAMHSVGIDQLDRIEAVIDAHLRYDDPEEAATWMIHLVVAATQEGQFDRSLAAFQRLRQLHASGPRFEYLRPKVLWYFKWIATKPHEFASVPVETIERIFTEMESFYEASGEPVRACYSVRFQVACDMGRLDEAERWFEKWEASADEKGNSNDCEACDVARRVERHLMRREPVEAIDAAIPVVEQKINWCDATRPMLCRLLSAALAEGKPGLAHWIDAVSVRRVRRRTDQIAATARILAHRAFLGRARENVRLGAAMFRRIDQTLSDASRFVVLRCGAIWLAVLRLEGATTVKLLPCRTFPEGTIDPADGAARCVALARELAVAFDARNGNDDHAQRVDEVELMIRRLVDLRQNPPADDATDADDAGEQPGANGN